MPRLKSQAWVNKELKKTKKNGKTSVSKKPTGRPELYTDALAEEVCDAISGNAVSLEKLCARYDHWPDADTIRKWISRKPGFLGKYLDAKQKQAHHYAAEAMEVAYDESRKTDRANLIVNTIKWHTSKLAPKLYGEHYQAEAGLNKDTLDTIKTLSELINKHAKDY